MGNFTCPNCNREFKNRWARSGHIGHCMGSAQERFELDLLGEMMSRQIKVGRALGHPEAMGVRRVMLNAQDMFLDGLFDKGVWGIYILFFHDRLKPGDLIRKPEDSPNA